MSADVDVIVGGAGPDVLVGSNGDDTIDGGPGDDQIAGLAGRDALLGGPGDGGSDTIDGGDDPDQMEGDGGEDTLTGGTGADTASGGGGDDELRGGAGDDDMRGDEADDHLEGGGGDDRFLGGGGLDQAEYPNGRAVTVTLDGRAGDGRAGERDNVAADVEDVLGGRQQDTFIGAPRVANRLSGGSGQDYVDGGPGRGDVLTGGAANDVLRGRDGIADSIRCGPGKRDFAIVDRRDRVRTVGREACERFDDGTRSSPRSGDVRVVPDRCAQGDLEMRLPAMTRLVPLEDRLLLPLRTDFASEACGVLLQKALGGGITTRLRAPGTRIEVETPGALTRVRLDPPQCPAGAAHQPEGARHRDPPATLIAALRRRRARRASAAQARSALEVSAGGILTSAGSDAKWRTVMNCASTRIQVSRGVVLVVDRRNGRRVRLRGGRSYTAGRAG